MRLSSLTDTPDPEAPPMPLARLRAELEVAARNYAAASKPGSQEAVMVIAGPGQGECEHVTISLCPVPTTAASTLPAVRF